MEKYSSYKDSGVKWLGEIPSHWETACLGKKCKFSKGLQFTKSDLIEEGLPVVSYGQVHAKNNTRTHLSEELVRFVPISFAEGHDNAKVKIGEFIVADTSEDIEGSGNMAYNDCMETLYGGYHTILIKDLCFENKKYLAYLFNSVSWRSQIRSLVNGVKVYTISREFLKQSVILYPPKSEQDAIVSYLDTVTSQIDVAIEQQKKMIELLNERKQIIINNAVTKGLDPNVKMKDSGVDWIGEIPEGWEVSKFKFHGYIKSGDSIKNEDVKAEGDFPVWGGNGLMGYHNKHNIENNAFVIGRVGALCGNVRYVETPVFVTDNALIFQILSTVEHKFLYYAMVAADFNKLNTSNAQPLITGTKVKNVSFAYPSYYEQIRIVEFVENKLKIIENGIDVITNQISLLQERKQIIINEVVTGKVKVV